MTTDEPSRRRLLAGAGAGIAAAATAGCLGSVSDLFGEGDGMTLRVSPASRNATETRCRLSADFVAAHPPLDDALTEARGSDGDGWVTRSLSLSEGESLGADLGEHCGGDTRGIYRYEGDWFFVSLRYEDPNDHGHAGGGHGDGTAHDHAGEGGNASGDEAGGTENGNGTESATADAA